MRSNPLSCTASAGLAFLLVASVLAVAPTQAQFEGSQAQSEGSRVVVLLHHPYDRIDPFGVPYPDPSSGQDTFTARHLAASQNGRFDFPTFVADGVRSVVSVPDPNRPFDSVLSNYTAAVLSRLALGSPGTLALDSQTNRDGVAVTVSFTPSAPLQDPRGDALHLFAAVAEDFIHYQPDARISNGVTEHRFTVRALVDLGPVDLSQAGVAAQATHTFASAPDWEMRNLLVAAWLGSGTALGRFGAGEVLQAAWAPVGQGVRQEGKAVLVEVYSATWCTPCLYGDLAAERLAVEYGGAAAAAEALGPKYFTAPAQPVLAVGAALAAGAVAVAAGRARRT